MKTSSIINCLTLVWLAGILNTGAQVPGIITYQGRVTSNGTNFTGTGQFKFILVKPGLPETTLWSQDENKIPATVISVPVTNGLFTVAIGDTTVAGMLNPIPPQAFNDPDVRLRIWFNDGATGFAQLAPDQRLTSVGYAMRADNVPDGAITGAQIANGVIGPFQLGDGAVTTPKLANAAVTAAKLSDGAVTTDKIAADSITGLKVVQNSLSSEDIADTLRLRDLQVESASGLDRVQLTEANNSGVIYMNHGSIGRFFEAYGTADGGFLRLFDALGGLGAAQATVELGSSSVGGYGRFLQDNESTGVIIQGQNGATAGGAILLYRESGLGLTLQGSTSAGQGSLLTLYNGLGDVTLTLDGDASGRGSAAGFYNGTGGQSVVIDGQSTAGGGEVSVRDLNGAETFQLLGSTGAGQGSLLTMYNGLGSTTVSLDADSSGRGSAMSFFNGTNDATVLINANSGGAGLIQLRNNQGFNRAELDGQGASGGGEVILRDEDGTATVQIEAAEGAGNGAQIALYRGAGGNATIVLDADFNGEGRISTQVLEITGGSDLSENFDIQSADAKPGMIVSIDSRNPGELHVSSRAYDRTVAGVMSGAGGVKPGMLMGQRGTKADGKHPVALTGRVYCLVDASAGPIQPGDLLTTSDTPGHGMKVTEHARAQGAIIGKAMTGLATGKGLVLVLVSLQ